MCVDLCARRIDYKWIRSSVVLVITTFAKISLKVNVDVEKGNKNNTHAIIDDSYFLCILFIAITNVSCVTALCP